MFATKMSFEILIIIIVGIFIGKMKLVKDDFADQLSSVVVNICMPCLIVDSMCISFSTETLKSSAWLIILSSVEILIGFLIGHVKYIIGGKTIKGKIERYGLMFGNISFIGLPIIESFKSEILLFYYSIVMIPIRIAGFTLPGYLLSANNEEQKKKKIKDFFSPAICALILGIIMYLTGFRFPVIIADVITMIRNLTSCLGLLICGIVLSKFNLKSLISVKYLSFTLIRTIIQPALFLLLAVTTLSDVELIRILVICGACPCASLTVPFTLKYNPNDINAKETAGACVFLSTLVSVFTIPLWLHILDLLL